ncbi:MAG: hypothetical protein PVF65_06645 [Sphingomonadales bacterium]
MQKSVKELALATLCGVFFIGATGAAVAQDVEAEKKAEQTMEKAEHKAEMMEKAEHANKEMAQEAEKTEKKMEEEPQG